MRTPLRLGTRRSPLALIQAGEVKERLIAAHPRLRDPGAIEIVPIHTEGDWQPGQRESRFSEFGGNKGLFTKQIEEALLGDVVDLAVHSMKDVAGKLPDRLEIAALLPRADARDAFIGRDVQEFLDLPQGAVIGTSSIRRQVQILNRRPDLSVVPLRGNVETRLKKLADGQVDATLLAVAGLARLGLMGKISSVLPQDLMLPSAAQGAIGVEIRRDDEGVRDLLKPIRCRETSICVLAERAMVEVLDGSCQTPIGALAELDGDTLTLHGMAAMQDGTGLIRLKRAGAASDFDAIGRDLGAELKSRFPHGFQPS